MSENSSIDCDLAAEMAEKERTALIRRTRAQPFIAGVAGVCVDCSEERARLVNGRCAFCRDGRTRE